MVAVCAGIGAAAWLPWLLPVWLAAALVAAATAWGWRRGWRLLRTRLAFGGALGLLWGTLYGVQVTGSLLPVALEQQPLIVQGRIVDLIAKEEAFGRPAQRFLLRVEHCFLDDESLCPVALHTVQLTAYRPLEIASGERWQMRVKLKRPHGFANPGGFDFESWQVQRRISATGSVRGRDAVRLEEPGPWSVDHRRAQLRDYLLQRLESFASRHLLIALLVADGSGIAREQWQLFRDTGTIHLFVVSGSHIAFTGGLVWWLGRGWRRLPWSSGSRREQFVCAVPALLVATGYALLAGMGLPIQRALIMFAVVLLATTLRRETRFADALLLALTIVLLRDPLAARDAGCWFSFAAVGALALAVTAAQARSWGWLRAQWLVFVACVPILLLIGGQLSLLSLPANVLAVPLTTVVTLPAALLALLTDTIEPSIGELCWQGADLSLRALLLFLERLHAPLRGLVLPLSPTGGSLLFALAAALLLCLPRGLPGRALAPLLMLPLLWPRHAEVDQGALRVTVIDVGQGLSVLVETRHHRLLYDTGPAFGSGATAAENAVLPVLRQRGVDALDLLMVSHRDNDHAGGVATVLDAVPTRRVSVGERLRVDAQQPCHAGEQWQWDDVRFDVLAPDSAWRERSGNNRSCVLLIDAGGQRVLLTGDIERRVEQWLLDADALSPVTLLIAPHHGSRSSSSPAFVTATRPQHVVFSAGYRNAFGHPHPRVADRYAASGARAWNTAASGALIFELAPHEETVVTEFRRVSRRYWDLR
jgi:competence protein ComEC